MSYVAPVREEGKACLEQKSRDEVWVEMERLIDLGIGLDGLLVRKILLGRIVVALGCIRELKGEDQPDQWSWPPEARE